MAQFKVSSNKKLILGVCGGLEKQFGLNAWIFRILFILFGVCLVGIVLYFILAFIGK